MMKVCTKCKVEKPFEEFHKHRTTKDGYCHECKACVKVKTREYYLANKENINAKNKIYREDNAEKVAARRKKYTQTEAFKEAAKIRYARWALNNSEKIKERFQKYREDNRDKVRERSRNWARNNLATNTKWQRENPEKRKEVARNYVRRNKDKMAQYRADNIERISELAKQWRQRNPHKRAASNAKRESIKRLAVPAYANLFFIEEAYELAALRTAIHGFTWHVDHIVPLVGKYDRKQIVCGLHVENNLQVIPGKENMRKGSWYWPDMP